jgi:hypothetical protein
MGPPYTQLDAAQVITHAFNEAENRIMVDIGATVTLGGELEVAITAPGDNIAISDGTHTLAVNPDGSLNFDLNGLTNFQTSQYAVATSATQLTPTPMTSRSSMSIKVVTTGTVYIGNSNAVTASTGYPLFNGEALQMDLTPSQAVWAIGSVASTAYVLEIGD